MVTRPADLDSVPAPADDPGLARLRAMPGVDVAVGLRAVRGRPERYLALLRGLVDSLPADLPALDARPTPKDRDAMRRFAHRLRGTGGTLGLTALADDATRLEMLLREAEPNGPPAKTLHDRVVAVREDLQRLRRALSEPLERDAMPASVAARSAHAVPAEPAVPAHDLLPALDALLMQGSLDALAYLDAQAPALQAVLGERFVALQAQVRRFDLDAALQTLRAGG